MNDPKLHHYVPQFYLRLFLDAGDKRLWVYDKNSGKIFKSTPDRIAAETYFYRLPEPLAEGNDPLAIEKGLADLETKASAIFKRLVREGAERAAKERVELSDSERILLSEFISTQYFRTLELRDLMSFLMENAGIVAEDMDPDDRLALHFTLLADSGFIEELADSIHNSIWIFAKNSTANPLITSDHPVCIKTGDNRSWIKGFGPLKDGQYIVFPISPTLMLFCHEPEHWAALRKFDLCISPVALDEGMVHHENCGQAFMASRFLFSSADKFEEVRDFIPTIGTDRYAPAGQTNTEAIQLTATFLKKKRRKPK